MAGPPGRPPVAVKHESHARDWVRTVTVAAPSRRPQALVQLLGPVYRPPGWCGYGSAMAARTQKLDTARVSPRPPAPGALGGSRAFLDPPSPFPFPSLPSSHLGTSRPAPHRPAPQPDRGPRDILSRLGSWRLKMTSPPLRLCGVCGARAGHGRVTGADPRDTGRRLSWARAPGRVWQYRAGDARGEAGPMRGCWRGAHAAATDWCCTEPTS